MLLLICKYVSRSTLHVAPHFTCAQRGPGSYWSGMAGKQKAKIEERDLKGFKHFKLLLPVLEKLHDTACTRDIAGNRKLHYDQYTALILLYFFNPIVTSLRGIQQAGELKKVQRLLGCPRASLGSLSEAARVFDADLLREVIGDLLDRLSPIQKTTAFDDVKGIITLVDGTYLPALSTMVEAIWRNNGKNSFKLHTHFELLKGVPTRMDLTAGKTGETAVLKTCLQPDRVYVMDRGYTDFPMFHKILEAASSLVCRIPDHTVFEVVEERPLSPVAQDANILRDAIVRFTGNSATKIGLSKRPMRVVTVKCKPHLKPSGKNGRGGPEQGETLLIATDILDIPAEVIGLIYKKSWAVETFFRFFKHILGCRHLLSHSTNGIEIQMYMAIIACLLIALWTGRKPTLRTYEMICFYFSGLAGEEELLAHIEKLPTQS